ncbi:unnamed protein product [Caenorhabditis angaria]|uniref:Uncharacterized protein n=1 Tax=Caenorhabditis angaria TaxID=860376 RepID=A0A9P1IID9_9PELO|nr:unnamed protein product [Caenorhabditis angaria]
MLRIYEENGNFGNEDFAFDLATTSELHGFLEERDLFKKIRDFYNVKDGKRIRIHLKLHRITQNLDMSWERKNARTLPNQS